MYEKLLTFFLVQMGIHAMHHTSNSNVNPNFMFLCKNTHASYLFSTKSTRLTFLDDGCVGHLASVGGPYADVGDGEFGWGQQGGGAHRRVVEKGWSVTLSAALAPVAVDGCLQLSRRAQPPLFTFIWIEVLHIPEQNRKKQ